jgi:hypothetical protein
MHLRRLDEVSAWNNNCLPFNALRTVMEVINQARKKISCLKVSRCDVFESPVEGLPADQDVSHKDRVRYDLGSPTRLASHSNAAARESCRGIRS